MAGERPQLRRDSNVLSAMASISQERAPPRWDTQRGPQSVSTPTPHEGVRRALLGSFGSIPAMPDEFIKLLDRLR